MKKKFYKKLKDAIEKEIEIVDKDGTVKPLILTDELIDIIIEELIVNENYELCAIVKNLKETL